MNLWGWLPGWTYVPLTRSGRQLQELEASAGQDQELPCSWGEFPAVVPAQPVVAEAPSAEQVAQQLYGDAMRAMTLANTPSAYVDGRGDDLGEDVFGPDESDAAWDALEAHVRSHPELLAQQRWSKLVSEAPSADEVTSPAAQRARPEPVLETEDDADEQPF